MRAGELLEAADALEGDTRSRGGQVAGTLRINAPVTFGNLHLAPLWPVFLAANPGVTLDITLNDRTVDLVEEGFDVAVRISRMPDSQLVSRRLATTRIVLCAAPAYLAAHGTPRHPRDLSGHQVLAYAYWSGGDDWRFSGPDGEAGVRIRPRLRTNSGDTCRAAALAGHGLILQPDFLVGEDLRRGDLVEVLPEYRSLELGIHAVYPSRRHLPLKTRRLVDFLAEAFAAPAW